MTNLCLGMKKRIYDPRVPTLHKMLRLAVGAKTVLPAVPTKTNWRAKITNWQMLDNDNCGDCMVAAMMHAQQGWMANNDDADSMSDTDSAISNYEKITLATNGAAYDSTNGANDTGLVPDYAVRYWMNAGIALNKNVTTLLDGQAEIDPADFTMVTRAIDYFGGVFAGFELPLSAQTENSNKVSWSSTEDDVGSWGGHATWAIDYDETYIYVVTWGGVQPVEHKFWIKYCVQVKALLQRSWINSKSSVSPSGLNLQCLDEQIVDLRGTLGSNVSPIAKLDDHNVVISHTA